MQRLILVLVPLVVAFAKPMIEPNKQELCECGVFDDEKVAPVDKPLMTRQLTMEISCSEPKAKDHCKHLCIFEAKLEEGNAAGYLCGKLKGKHGDHVKITLFYKACGLAEWLYTGHSESICCHDGECTVNCTGEITDKSCFATNSTKAKTREVLSDPKPTETPATGVKFPTLKPTIDLIPFPKAADVAESDQNVQTAKAETAKPESAAKTETGKAVSVPNAAAAAATEQKGSSEKQTTMQKSEKTAPAAKKATGRRGVTSKAAAAARTEQKSPAAKQTTMAKSDKTAPAAKKATGRKVVTPNAADAEGTEQTGPSAKKTTMENSNKTAPAVKKATDGKVATPKDPMMASTGSLFSVLEAVVAGAVAPAPKPVTSKVVPVPKAAAAAATKHKVPTQKQTTKAETAPASGGAVSVPKKETGGELPTAKEPTSASEGKLLSVPVPTTLPTRIGIPDSKNSTTETSVTVPAPKNK